MSPKRYFRPILSAPIGSPMPGPCKALTCHPRVLPASVDTATYILAGSNPPHSMNDTRRFRTNSSSFREDQDEAIHSSQRRSCVGVCGEGRRKEEGSEGLLSGVVGAAISLVNGLLSSLFTSDGSIARLIAVRLF